MEVFLVITDQFSFVSCIVQHGIVRVVPKIVKKIYMEETLTTAILRK